MILDDIIAKGLKKLNNKNDRLRIDNIILGKSLYSMKDCDSVFTDMNLCLVLLENGYGFSYFQEELDYTRFSKFIGKDISDVLKLNIKPYFKVALADAIYSHLNRFLPTKELIGNIREKAIQRAVELLKDIPSNSKVVLIGAASEIIEQSIKEEVNLTVVDLAPNKLGLNIENVKIIGGSNEITLDIIKHSDYAIVSGMVFSTDTADSVIKIAKDNNVKLIFFMETGSNFGQELLNYGADKILSEYFPYYDFYGNTKYQIFSKTQSKLAKNH
ncbi:hypothetical protein HYS93_03960 [Candidatus Daviesbacteria bacterium]|nr:hypothetical protein [Candidatus Daviesbacteria bacterium]